MKVQIFHQILAGFIFFCICSLGRATPATDKGQLNERNQNEEDYQYSDDESAPDVNTKLIGESPISAMVPFFSNTNITTETFAGKNAVLECPVKNLSDHNVVLWYKDNNVLTSGAEVLNKEYSLNITHYSLQILNVTEDNQGEYYCEIQPQKIRLHTTLIVRGDPIEAIIPSESSKSSQESVHFKLSSTLTTFSMIGIFLFLRI